MLALVVFLCQDIKLTTLRRPAQEDAADEGDALGVVMATAQAKIITQIVKKNVMENIIPIVIAAKHLVRRKHSHINWPSLCYHILYTYPQLFLLLM